MATATCSIKQEFGPWLKAARKRAGCTQVYIAKILGVSSRSISQWERGKQTPAAYAQDWIRAHLESRIRSTGRRSVSRHSVSGRDAVVADGLDGERSAKCAEERNSTDRLGTPHDKIGEASMFAADSSPSTPVANGTEPGLFAPDPDIREERDLKFGMNATEPEQK